MKHSPGRWVAEFVGHGGPGDNPEEVWEVNNGHARIAEYLTEADARLVAAAPEMLDALRRLMSEEPPDGTEVLNAMVVIAKAEGRLIAE